MKACFFVSRIGDVGSPERDCSDKLLKYIIEPALRRCGYEAAKRADYITKPGIIVAQIFKELWQADLVIADLTGHNPNVFYELAVRHVARKPFVQMIRKNEKLPFDIAANRTVYFDFDVAEAGRATDELESMIKGAESDPSCSDTTLTFAIDTLSLGNSGKSSEMGIADALFMLQGLQGMVSETLEVTRSEAHKRRKIDSLDAFLPLFEELLPLLPFFKDAIRNAKKSVESAIPEAAIREHAKPLQKPQSELAES